MLNLDTSTLENPGAAMVVGSDAMVLPPVLDACCGPRHFWFDKNDRRALFADARRGDFPMPRGRKSIVVRPDVVADFTKMPFPNDAFHLVVFDPPHHTSKQLGTKHVSIMQSTYGILPREGWEDMLRAGFAECFRVLKPNGTLIFKWGGREIGVRRVLSLTPYRPLFGHRTRTMASGGATHWVVFIKQNVYDEPWPGASPDIGSGNWMGSSLVMV